MKQNNIIYFKFPWDRIAITQYYSNQHKAIDNSSKGNIYAYLPCEAKILKNQWDNDYGWMVEYEAKDKRGTFVMANGHMKYQSNLKVGATYKMDTKIGEIGSTGKSTGPHDHFRISLNGVRKNPLDYLYVYEGQEVHKEDTKLVKYYKDTVKIYKIIVNKIPVYTNSTNAKIGKNAVGTWGMGTYYIFNEASGMFNVTKEIGIAGAWINPADNVIEKEQVVSLKEDVEENPINTSVEEVKPSTTEEILKDNGENSEKETVIENKTDEMINDTPIEKIEQKLEEKTKEENIFVKIIKSVINFIIGIFKK